MGKYIFWFVLTALLTGCSGEHDGEDGRTSATRVVNGSSAAQHSSVVPGTCATCHNGTAAKGKESSHIPTTDSCDVCHQTSGWEPARINHSNVAPGTCATCHNGTYAKGKKSSHIATTASCDICHLTTAWKPATMGHSNVASGICATCHNGTTARGKSSSHIAAAASCDTCHLTTAWTPATAMSHSNVTPGTCATCHNGTTARGKSSMHISTADSCDACHLTTGWIPSTMATSTIDFPVEAVFASLASTASTYTASATDAAGNNFSLSVGRIPGPDKTDPLIYAAPLKTYSQSNILKKNGTITSTKNFEDFYSVAPFYLFGSLNNMYGSSNNMKVTTQLPLPSTSRVGASGVIYKGRNYINNATLAPDMWYAMWSLEADSATTAWLCLSVEITPANASAVSTAEADCFRINQAGDISGFKSDSIENGIALSYR